MPNSAVCVDANLVVRLVVDPHDRVVWDRWEAWEAAGQQPVAPTLLPYEVTNAVYRLGRSQSWTTEAIKRVVATARGLTIRLHDGDELHDLAVDLAARFNRPASYDAHYLALAERLGVEFWTVDRKLANAVRPALPWVHLLGEA